MDISVKIFGKNLRNPLILASGILGTTRDLISKVSKYGVGAITIKSISVESRKGHTNPVVLPFGGGFINAVGYSNPGIKQAILEFNDLKQIDCPVIGSIIGTSLDDFIQIASEFDKLDFSALEVPISCPHTPGYGKIAKQDNPETVFQIVSTICSYTSKPLFVKVPPAISNLVEIAKAAEAAGAYGITAVNTIGPGMLIDINSRKPYLGFGIGGISGPILKPLAIASVFELFKAVNIPIIGVGGVSTGYDVIEMIMAGATAVGIGTAVLLRGFSVFEKINKEMGNIMDEQGILSLAEIRGLAHD